MESVRETWPALLGVALYVVASLTLGLRLLRLGWADGRLPELTVGVAFVTGGAFGAAFQVLPQLPGILPPIYDGVSLAFGKLAVHAAVLCQALFTWQVFRPHSAAARRFLIASVLLWAAVSIGYALDGGIVDPRYSGVWFWLEYAAQGTLIAWSALEPLLYWRKMRRRERLGLADPVVTSRFLLWGVGLGLGLAASTMGPVIHLLPASWDAPMKGLAAGFGLVSAGCLWLTFFTPAWWVRRQRRRGARAAAACRSSPSR
jgi:hypothetical protein